MFKVLNWILHSFRLLEIIQVLDSISWVRCASGNVSNKRKYQVYVSRHLKYSECLQGTFEHIFVVFLQVLLILFLCRLHAGDGQCWAQPSAAW